MQKKYIIITLIIVLIGVSVLAAHALNERNIALAKIEQLDADYAALYDVLTDAQAQIEALTQKVLKSAEPQSISEIVYITKNGDPYHKSDDCPLILSLYPAVAVDRADAVLHG
ncbi:MAG: hypothetical protein IJV43_00305, partial [Oscillospiraceae bacterium]|nr:hypothetical protein [Oscillospiraceae bacterium]